MYKKIALFILIFFCVGFGHSFAYNANLSRFSDVINDDWATASIYKLSTIGIISGYPDKSFRGNEPLTREAFLKMLMSSDLMSKATDREMLIQDISKTRWSYPYIKRAYDLQLIDFMIQNEQFLPEGNITRGDVAVVIGKYLLMLLPEEKKQEWLTTGWRKEEISRNFSDRNHIESERKPFLYYSSLKGIMVGDQTRSFRAHDLLSRKEAAVIIDRMLDMQITDHDLEAIGFYAIKSFNNIEKMNLIHQVIFGWSNLTYTEEGKASLNIKTTEYSIPTGWETVVSKAEHQGLKTEIMVFADNKNSNVSRFLNDSAAKESFLQSLMETLANEHFGFTGICIDFEGLKDTNDRALYLTFLQQLKTRIGELTLSVTVPPIEYYKGYDLDGIGKIADQVIIMAYDFTHKESRLPSAPLPLVNEAITTAMQFIPKGKLVLGISKQANQWIIGTNGDVQLLNPAIDLVEERIKKADSVTTFSFPFFLTHIQFTNQGNENSIWYEDSRSIEQKIWLAKYYGLKGVSLWYMGNYTADDWEVIKRMNNVK